MKPTNPRILTINGGSSSIKFALFEAGDSLRRILPPGLTCPKQAAVEAVAAATVKCLLRAVPAAVPGIAFLSGGQPAELASAHLNAMNVRFKSRLPWTLTFSFARAIQQPALEIWRGEEANASASQQALYHRARCNRAARSGEYTTAMETTGA